MNLETYIPREDEWRHEFTSGRSKYVNLNQNGNGMNESADIKLVTPSAQAVQIAKSNIKHIRRARNVSHKKRRRPVKRINKKVKNVRRKKSNNTKRVNKSRSRNKNYRKKKG